MKEKILDRYDSFLIGILCGLIIMDVSDQEPISALIKVFGIFVYVVLMWIINKRFANHAKSEEVKA